MARCWLKLPGADRCGSSTYALMSDSIRRAEALNACSTVVRLGQTRRQRHAVLSACERFHRHTRAESRTKSYVSRCDKTRGLVYLVLWRLSTDHVLTTFGVVFLSHSTVVPSTRGLQITFVKRMQDKWAETVHPYRLSIRPHFLFPLMLCMQGGRARANTHTHERIFVK